MLVLLCFAVHYTPGPSNSLFGSVRGMDGNVHVQFQGQASFFSYGITPERNTLILGEDESTLRIIISTAILEGENRTVYHKSELIFRDATSNTG